ncbi:MAG: carbohydrate-binding protein [Bacteroidales bacterium]|nr:carbohydrate-binding protein [Bacteroidales bacterium]
MKKIVLLILTLLSITIYSQQTSQKWTDVNYVGDGQVYHNCDIYLPQAVKESYPVVIYIYGSAWQSNNSKTSDMSTVGAALLTAGYAVVSINHRSSSDAKWPAQINDVKAAIRFVKANSAKYKFDTCFVAMSGSSSGGHLSGIAGVTRNVKSFTVGSTTMNIEGTLGTNTAFSSSVDAVCDWFGPKYLLQMDICGNTTTHGAADSPGSAILGCAIKVCTDNAAMLEPKTYIDKTDPPFLIFHGTSDNVVPYCASVNLNNDLKAAGVQSEYVEIPGGGHYSNVHTATNFAKMVSFLNAAREAKCNGIPKNISLSITSPTINTSFEAPANIEIAATATTTVGTITKVQFFNGTTLLGEDVTAPYTYSWSNVSVGTQSICVKATNSNNETAQTCLEIKVSQAQAAYNGKVHTIPGKIEFEHYDVGGNNVAYLDNAADNTGGAEFRLDEDVDIEDCTDAGTGYNIGYATAGEWLEYTVNVAAAGEYELTFRAACNGTGRTVSLSSDGTTIASNIAIPNTTGWQVWEDVKTKVTLTAGKHILRLTIGTTDYVNLNYMSFASEAVAPTISIVTPEANSQFTTAQTIDITTIATATEATISSVTFSVAETLKNTDVTAPYSYSLSGFSAGIYTIEVEATDSNGSKATASVTISVINAPVSILLKKGWNLIGCPIEGSTDIAKALSSVWQYTETVKDLDSFWLKSNTIPALNSLMKLTWGEGYLIKVTSDCNLDWIVR